MFCGSTELHQPFTVKKRSLTFTIVILFVFIVLYFRTLFILHRERRRLNENTFLYLTCLDNLKVLKSKSTTNRKETNFKSQPPPWPLRYLKSPRLLSILESLNGTKTITGIRDLKSLDSPHLILPNLKIHNSRLVPAFHISCGRSMVDVVIGVTTVKRYKADYLMDTLRDLVYGLSEDEKLKTLIIVMIGEIDSEYVLRTALSIEKNFTEAMNSGLIEVISPLNSYYPNEDIPATLGDTLKRTLWRAKHVLDCVYVMSYGHTKGSYYLIMEDDIVAMKGYMTEIKQFIAYTTMFKRHWVIIDFCHRANGFGKLLRSSDVGHLMKFLQLFYYTMPLDFLLESYLSNLVCGLDKHQAKCNSAVDKIKGRSPIPLFKHVGLYSSLKGKIQSVEGLSHSTVPNFYPHNNPPLKYIHCSIKSINNHTIEMAYEGISYFWGIDAKEGSIIEFWFQKPIVLKRYKLQSGNYEHKNYLLYNTIIEIWQIGAKNFTIAGYFDEFGCSEENIEHLGEITAIRLRMTTVKRKHVILSEIELVPANR